jgi:hypothetical protein
MNNPTQTQTNGHAAAPVAPAATYSEAPASLTLKIAYRGYADILFTLRDSSGAGLLDKLNVVIDRFEKMGITPSSVRGGGPATASGDAPMCPDDHGPMKQGKRGWFCSKVVTEVQGKKIYCRHTA